MDQVYNDIHYINYKTNETLVCIRQVKIKKIDFKTSIIKIEYDDDLLGKEETLVIPKLQRCHLIID